MWGGAGWRIGRIAFPRRRVRARKVPARPATQDPGAIDSSNVDLPFQGRARIQAGRSFVPIPPAAGLNRSALEGTVLRVPCGLSDQQRGSWRSSVSSAGPPSPKLGRGRRLSAAARQSPSAGCARLDAPAAPRPGRATCCAPECAHALTVESHAVRNRRIHGGSAGRRYRAGAAPRFVLAVDVIAANQTSKTRDE
jgi:hypothetical protein